MDYSSIYIIIGYTLIVIIATFLLREKYPERYSIGCILCLLAPAWGQFYKNKKSSLFIWFLFMAIDRGVGKTLSGDMVEMLIAWVIFGGISSVTMFFRLRADRPNTPITIDNYTQETNSNELESSNTTQALSNDNKNENHETTQPVKLSGWQRLWIVTSVLYLMLIIVAVVNDNSFPKERTEYELRNYYSTTFYSIDDRGNMAPLPKETRSLKVLANEEHEFVTKKRYIFIGQMAILWVFPCLAVYALGLSINWIYKGFRAKKRQP